MTSDSSNARSSNTTDTYYQRERVRVICEVEIGYKHGSDASRADALARAREAHLDAAGVSGNGCYSARVVSTQIAGTP